MSRIVVIGGSGHIGSYLLPRLVDLDHEVINVSRGLAKPYQPCYTWKEITNVNIDRDSAEQSHTFGTQIAELRPDIVVDLICFNLNSTKQIVTSLRNKIEHYIFCSSIWVYGCLTTVPSSETEPPNPIDDYGRGKAASEAWLMREARLSGFPATIFRPGHIVGNGWCPITPQGNVDPNVFSKIACGEQIALPNLGSEMLHHVHADDIAQWIICAVNNRPASIGEIFNAVSEKAVTLKGYAEAVYRWFGREPRIAYRPFDEWLSTLPDEYKENTKGHIVRSSCHSMQKSRELIGFTPRYSSLEAVRESLEALTTNGNIQFSGLKIKY